MKKAIALVLAAILVLALAACGGDNNKVDKDAVSNLTDEQLVEKLSAICDGKTGEMMVETTSFAALKENGFETDGLFKNWFSNMDVPAGAKIAVNQPIMGQAHVVLLIQPAEGTDINKLKADLDSNANPNWMICMTADSVASAVKDGLILFVMTSKAELGLDAQAFIDAFNA